MNINDLEEDMQLSQPHSSIHIKEIKFTFLQITIKLFCAEKLH